MSERKRIGFLIGALPYFKLFAPIIEEALKQGIEVYVLLRDPVELRNGPKAYQRATPEKVPTFDSGQPEIRRWDSDSSLIELCERENINSVVSIWLYPRDYVLCRNLRARGVRWVALQHRNEHLIMPMQTILQPDINGMFSQGWINHAVGFFEKRLRDDNENWEQTKETMLSKMEITGCAQLDAIKRIDPVAIRRRYRIPEGKRVVVWLPHDYHEWDLWEVLAFRRHRRPRLLARALRERRWDVLRGMITGPTEARMAKSLRAFCDRNDAFLLVKSRIKDRPSSWDRKIADHFLFDEGYYPPTIMEVLAVADLCVHVFSVAAMEAAAQGVPGLCLMPPPASTFVSDPNTAWTRLAGDLKAPETMWNYSGVSTLLSISDAIKNLPETSLETFKIDEERRLKYVDRFVGPCDGQSSKRVLEMVMSQGVVRV